MNKNNPNNDKSNPHIRYTTQLNDQGIRFAEMELAGDEQDMPLQDRLQETREGEHTVQVRPEPKAALVIEPQPLLEMDWNDSFRYVTKEQQFVLKARELAWHVEAEVAFTPFKSYWPIFDQMTAHQFKWYFYWREEVRSGRYPDTDLSYLFVYFYELIHGVGWSDPRQGYELMETAWAAYRKRHAKLDAYLREWLYDFMLVHGLDMPIRETYQRLPRQLSDELKEREWFRRFSLQPMELTWDLLLDLIDYEVEKSRFYQENGRKDLERYAPKVVALVDSYWGKTGGQRFIERFKPRARQVKRPLFRSAVYDHGLHGRSLVLTIVSLSGHAPLRAYMTGLVRLTENILRELRGFKGRLRGLEGIGPEVKNLVERYLKKEIQQQIEAERIASLPEVQIDTRKLRRLQRESDEVRDMLLVEEAEQRQAEVPLQENKPKLADSAASGNQSAGGPTRPATARAPKRINKQPDVFQAVMDFDALAYEADDLLSQELERSAASKENRRLSVDPQETPETGASRMRESAASGGTKRSTVDFVIWNTDALDEGWQELAERLTSFHLRMLYAMKTGGTGELQRIAEEAGSMPALLLDEINEAAMETIGDLIVDGEAIADEYMEILETLQC